MGGRRSKRSGAIRWSSIREIDWVIKKRLIESYMSRKKLDWSDSQVQMLDLQYHDLRPDKGLYFLLERQGKAERIVTDEEIQQRGPSSSGRYPRLFPGRMPAALSRARCSA